MYIDEEGEVSLDVIVDPEGETFWTTHKTMAELFGVSKQNVSYHLKDIFKTGELNQNSVVKKILTTASDGKKYNTNFYNLYAIISVGMQLVLTTGRMQMLPANFLQQFKTN